MNAKLIKLAQQIKENPNDTFSKFALALEFLKLGDNEKALRLFLNIMKNTPDYVGVYYHLGKLYEDLEKFDSAVETYKKGIKIATAQNDLHTKSELASALINLEIELE